MGEDPCEGCGKKHPSNMYWSAINKLSRQPPGHAINAFNVSLILAVAFDLEKEKVIDDYLEKRALNAKQKCEVSSM